MLPLPQGALSNHEGEEIQAFVAKNPEQAFQIIYRQLWDSRLLSCDHVAVRLGTLLRLISVALPDSDDFQEDRVWLPRRINEFLKQQQRQHPYDSVRDLFMDISDPHSVHYACSRRSSTYSYQQQKDIMRPYRDMLFPDPEQAAEERKKVKPKAVAAVITKWTSDDWLYLVTEGVAPALLKAARSQK
jgi:hypothetical protein